MTSYEDRWLAAQSFDPRQVHSLLLDLMEPRMPLYWIDLVISAMVGWSAFIAAVILTPSSLPGMLCLVAAVLALYRAALFIHELVHFRSRSHTRSFGRGWNLLIGCWLLVPYFMYEGHAEHHSKRLYGTAGDAEYLPFARLSRLEMIKVVGSAALLPLFGPIRFGILAPVSWLLPAARPWVYARASTIKIDLEYRGRPPRPSQRRSWLLQELACFAIIWSAVVLLALGVVPLLVPLCWYLLFLGIVTINMLRLLGAHRYLGNDSEASIVLQMIDTINYPGSPIAGFFWGPVGLRLHALHHLVPALPYHSFRRAHARLLVHLPADSAYRLTESPGLLSSIAALWRAPRPGVRDGAPTPHQGAA